MNRIEEIKERVELNKHIKKLNNAPTKDLFEHSDQNETDIQYLLSKLEIAEKALEVANRNISLLSIHNVPDSERRFAAETVIEEALKQLRE